MRGVFRNTFRLFAPPPREILSSLLQKADPRSSLDERLEWLESLLVWIETAPVHPGAFDTTTGQLQAVRLRFVLLLLDRHPEWKAGVAMTLQSLVSEISFLELLGQTGLTENHGFFAEAWRRVKNRLLPRPRPTNNALELFQLFFSNEKQAVWIENLPRELASRVGELLSTRPENPGCLPLDRFRRDAVEALVVLGSHLASLGLSPEIRRRLKGEMPVRSPFVRLNDLLSEMARTFTDESRRRTEPAVLDRAFQEAGRARAALQLVLSDLEESGVSLGLVFALEAGHEALDRIETLIALLAKPAEASLAPAMSALLAELAKDSAARHSIRRFIGSSLHLLARKAVERTGLTGEHYITRTRAEYFAMFRSAFGGGVLTVATSLGKLSIAVLGSPPFFEGLLSSINYALSFTVMQFMGFTLGTKQPSMTASALAGKLGRLEENGDPRDSVEEIARVIRSQFIAVVGNLGAVIPGCLIFDALHVYLFGRHVLGPDHALRVLGEFDPLHAPVLPLAAWTGVLLWASSLFGGWLENWFVFHRVPQGIADNRAMIRAFGKKRAARMSDWLSHNICGLGGNGSLGLLLGCSPVFGRLFGINLSVMHVTLSSGTFTFAVAATLGSQSASRYLVPTLGVLVMALMNFGVSFTLAFTVALKARNVDGAKLHRLGRELGSRFRRTPLEFFFPSEALKTTPFTKADHSRNTSAKSNL